MIPSVNRIIAKFGISKALVYNPFPSGPSRRAETIESITAVIALAVAKEKVDSILRINRCNLVFTSFCCEIWKMSPARFRLEQKRDNYNYWISINNLTILSAAFPSP